MYSASIYAIEEEVRKLTLSLVALSLVLQVPYQTKVVDKFTR